MDQRDELLQEIKTELQAIRRQAEQQTKLISSASTYALGYAIALGMNLGTKDTGVMEALLVSLLSWINVGYVLTRQLGA